MKPSLTVYNKLLLLRKTRVH